MKARLFYFGISLALFASGALFGQMFSGACFFCWLSSVPGQMWPAVIQAGASVVAIFATWHLARGQWKQHLAQEKAKDLDSVAAVAMLIKRAADIIGGFASLPVLGLPATTPSQSTEHALTTIATKLESLDLLRAPSRDALRMSMASANAIRKFLHAQARHSGGAMACRKAEEYSGELNRYFDYLLKVYQIPEKVDPI